jgi:hypothetical protein
MISIDSVGRVAHKHRFRLHTSLLVETFTRKKLTFSTYQESNEESNELGLESFLGLPMKMKVELEPSLPISRVDIYSPHIGRLFPGIENAMNSKIYSWPCGEWHDSVMIVLSLQAEMPGGEKQEAKLVVSWSGKDSSYLSGFESDNKSSEEFISRSLLEGYWGSCIWRDVVVFEGIFGMPLIALVRTMRACDSIDTIISLTKAASARISLLNEEAYAKSHNS